MLRVGGSGLGPYLPAVGSAGKIVRSDGTNWVASQDTWPDLVASGNVLYATAANTIGSSTLFNFNGSALTVGGTSANLYRETNAGANSPYGVVPLGVQLSAIAAGVPGRFMFDNYVNNANARFIFAKPNSAGNPVAMGALHFGVPDETAGSEDATMSFYTQVAGAFTLGPTITGANLAVPGTLTMSDSIILAAAKSIYTGGAVSTANLRMYMDATTLALRSGAAGFLFQDAGANLVASVSITGSALFTGLNLTPGAFVAADKYLVISAAGDVHKSALGPVS